MIYAQLLTLSLLGWATVIFSAAPTRTPTRAPTRAPTEVPTRTPTRSPTITTRAPTPRPSAAPSSFPSRSPTKPSPIAVPSNAELFAVVGGTECAEYLHYGTAALTQTGSSDGYSYYLKTNPTAGSTAHTKWLQIVTDGTNELFRIYWTFSVARTLSDRFVSAVNGNGEVVSFRVVDTANVVGNGAGHEFTYTGASWRFSDTAIMSATKFDTLGTTWGFSADDGCWGAGTGTLNANSGSLSNFWGTANINSADSLCSNIYVQGSVYAVNANARSYMYILSSATSKPTASPTTAVAPYELFAVVGSNACAEDLPYGPATLTEIGSSNGFSMYFSTSTWSGQQPHTEWLQIVTSGTSGELFRIYWTFSTAKTLANRFMNASRNGEWVSYRVVDTAGVAGTADTEYFYSGMWRFSDAAAITASKFTNTYTTSTGFSADDGAWGAAPTLINANGNTAIANFWGVGNFDTADSSSCNNVYANGVLAYSTSKVFMYITTQTVISAPSLSPSSVPGGTSSSSSKVAAFFSTTVITVIVVVVVALILLGLGTFCYWRNMCSSGQQSSNANDQEPVAAVVTIGGYDLGDVEVQVVSGGADGAGSIEMMKMSMAQGDHDPSAPPMYVPEADMVSAASAPPAAYFTVSAAAVPSTEVNYYATTTAHTQI